MSVVVDEALQLSRLFPRPLAVGALAIEAAMAREFDDVAAPDRMRCAQAAVATWAHELDKRGELAIGNREAALLYQIGRLAVQELDQGLLPRLQAAIEQAIPRAPMPEGGNPLSVHPARA